MWAGVGDAGGGALGGDELAARVARQAADFEDAIEADGGEWHQVNLAGGAVLCCRHGIAP